MAKAFKCDECGTLTEGDQPAFQEIHLGDIEVVMGFGYKPDEDAPKRELNPIEVAMGMSEEPMTRRADLCSSCMRALARLALEKLNEAPVQAGLPA